MGLEGCETIIGFLYGRRCRGGRCFEIFLRLPAELDDSFHQTFCFMLVFVMVLVCSFILLITIPIIAPIIDGIWGDPHPLHGYSFLYRSDQWALGQLAPTRARKVEPTGRNDAVVSIILVHAWLESWQDHTAMKADQSALMSPYSPSYSASGYASNPLQRKRCRQIPNTVFTPSRKSRRSI